MMLHRSGVGDDPSSIYDVNFTVTNPTGATVASGTATNNQTCTDGNGNPVSCSAATAVNCYPLASCDPNVAWANNSQGSTGPGAPPAATNTTNTLSGGALAAIGLGILALLLVATR